MTTHTEITTPPSVTTAPPYSVPDIEVIAASIRRIRKAKGLTLKQVEAISNGKWKAVVIGSYERCDRALSLNKALALAHFYQVPLDDLLGLSQPELKNRDRIVFDLRKVRQSQEPSLMPLQRLLGNISTSRRDWNGEIISVRESDAIAISAALGTPLESVRDGLEAFGLLFTTQGKA
ncbi:MAG: hypothetical protein RL414_261 [Actinomycetota bacterium]|jgi:transcriptional regulator with XRE-family HTH domain